MTELIKIEKRVIGAEDTNSVNARDLYTTLKIKQEFSNWIKAQINRAGLRENVDFITFHEKVKRGDSGLSSTKKEYNELTIYKIPAVFLVPFLDNLHFTSYFIHSDSFS